MIIRRWRVFFPEFQNLGKATLEKGGWGKRNTQAEDPSPEGPECEQRDPDTRLEDIGFWKEHGVKEGEARWQKIHHVLPTPHKT